MAAAKRIRASHIVRDIRSGLSDAEIMTKYRLSAVGLQSLFKQLLSSRVVRASEIYGRGRSAEHSVQLEDLREEPRHVIDFPLPVRDRENPTAYGVIRDISRNGCKIQGLSCEKGEERSFLIPSDTRYVSEPIEFCAKCRWVEYGDSSQEVCAGFQITAVNEAHVEAFIRTLEKCSRTDGNVVPESSSHHVVEEATGNFDLSNLLSPNVTSSGSYEIVGITRSWFSQLLQALPIDTLVVDTSYRVTFVNQHFKRTGVVLKR